MAIQELMTYKAKSFGMAEVGAANPTYKYLDGVMYSMTISQDTPEETPIEAEFTDTPLETIDTLAQYTIEFDLAKYNPDQIVELEGGVYNPSTGMYDLPTSSQKILKQCKIDFWNGLEYILIHKGKITTNWDGSDLKTTPLRLHVRIVALVHTNGKSVSKKFLPDGVTFENAVMSAITASTATATFGVSLSAGATITEKGVAYGLERNPTTSDSKKIATGTEAGSSVVELTGLTASTEYHLRPYVIMDGQTVYGTEIRFNTDATA